MDQWEMDALLFSGLTIYEGRESQNASILFNLGLEEGGKDRNIHIV